MLIVRTEKGNDSYFSSPEFVNLSQKDKEKKMKGQKTTLWVGNVEGRISIYKVTGEAQSICSSGSEKKTTSTLNVKKYISFMPLQLHSYFVDDKVNWFYFWLPKNQAPTACGGGVCGTDDTSGQQRVVCR